MLRAGQDPATADRRAAPRARRAVGRAVPPLVGRRPHRAGGGRRAAGWADGLAGRGHRVRTIRAFDPVAVGCAQIIAVVRDGPAGGHVAAASDPRSPEGCARRAMRSGRGATWSRALPVERRPRVAWGDQHDFPALAARPARAGSRPRITRGSPPGNRRTAHPRGLQVDGAVHLDPRHADGDDRRLHRPDRAARTSSGVSASTRCCRETASTSSG